VTHLSLSAHSITIRKKVSQLMFSTRARLTLIQLRPCIWSIFRKRPPYCKTVVFSSTENAARVSRRQPRSMIRKRKNLLRRAGCLSRYKHTAGLLPDGRVLVAGGSDDRDWKGTLRTAEIYNPQTRMFTAAPEMAAARFKLPARRCNLHRGRFL